MLLEQRYDAGFPRFSPKSRWMLATLQEAIDGKAQHAEHRPLCDGRARCLHLRIYRDQTSRHRAILSCVDP